MAATPAEPLRLARLGAGLLDLVLRCLPTRLVLLLAEAAGGAWYLLSPGRRRVADANLRIAFGEGLDDRARRRLAKSSFRSLTRVFAETALSDRLLRRAEGFRFLGDWDALDADAAAGRAGLIVTGHLGSWELGAMGVRRRGVALKAMARPVRSAVLEAFLTRSRGGDRAVIRKVGGLADVLRSLRAGTWIALLADQNAGRHGVFIPFFGLQASTFPTPAAIAARFGVPVYVGACLRRAGPPGSVDVHLERLEAGAAGVEAVMGKVNDRLEAWIRAEPAQYNWAHRRWKTRPPGRGRDEAGQPFYARLWPTAPDGSPIYGRETM